MARPETHDDLTKDQRKGPEVMRVNLDKLPASGPVLTALGAFLTAAEKAKLVAVKDGYGNLTVHDQPSADELDQILVGEQRDWERGRDLYDAALISGTEPEDYTKYSIQSWARKEGLRLPWEIGKDS